MKKRNTYIIWLIAAAMLLLLPFVFAQAEDGWFVNDGAGGLLPRLFDGVYAIGDGGTAPILPGDVYVLTGNGLQQLGSAGAVGGGGLVYDDHTIPVVSNTVRVGLNYYYSASRDSGVASAVLEVSSGGFSFGHYDSSGEFVEDGTTAADRVTVRPGSQTQILVADGSGSETCFSAAVSGKDQYLIVRPRSAELVRYAQRNYYGDFGFAVLGGGKLTVTNVVDLDHYVMGVCGCEMSESWPVEALKAQSVAARTYVQKMIRSSVYHYSCGFDVTADTYCQAYRGTSNVGPNIISAVQATSNQYLTYQDSLIDALYSASDGGATESNYNVFGNNAHPYLTGVMDPYEAAATLNPYASWKVTMTPAQLGAKVGLGAVAQVTPTYSDTGNTIKLELATAAGQKATVIRDSCRTVLGLKSIRYTVEKDSSGNFVFSGSGCGHQLGMSQWGAYAMAKYYYKDYKSILGFYYTGVGLSFGELK